MNDNVHHMYIDMRTNMQNIDNMNTRMHNMHRTHNHMHNTHKCIFCESYYAYYA